MRVHDRDQEPPFECSTELQVRGVLDGHRLECWSRYETTARGADETVRVWTVVVECVASFVLDAADVIATEEQVEAFALVVGTPVLHPYAREWTQTLTSHSQYPAFTMGLLEPLGELDPEQTVELPVRGDRIGSEPS